MITGDEISAAGGWCAPSSEMLYAYEMLRPLPDVWPMGLTEDDVAWLAEMLWLGGIDPDPRGLLDEMPTFSIRRGGIQFPVRP